MNFTINNFTDKLNFSKTLIAAFSVLLLTGMGTADSFTVDDDGGEYTSIQEAIDAAAEAGEGPHTVQVEAGTYEESITVDVEDLTLEGPNAGISGTNNDARDDEASFKVGGDITADNVTIDGVELTTGSDFISLTGEDTVIRNTVADVDGSAVVRLEEGSDGTVITQNAFTGDGGNFAINARQSFGQLIDGVEITDNRFESVTGDGKTVIQAAGFTNAEISGNRFDGISEDAIRLAGDVSGTEVTENEFANYAQQSGFPAGAIVANDASGDVTVENNLFEDAGGDDTYVVAYSRNDPPALDLTALRANNQYDENSFESGTAIVPGSSVEIKNIDQMTGYETIQESVNAAESGDTIEVGSGTYEEKVVVNTEDITILGPNSDVPYDGERVSEAEIRPPQNKDAFQLGADDVTVKGFDVKLNADSSGSNAFYVTSNNEDISGTTTVANNIVTAEGDVDEGINGVVVADQTGGPGTPDEVVLTGNEFDLTGAGRGNSGVNVYPSEEERQRILLDNNKIVSDPGAINDVEEVEVTDNEFVIGDPEGLEWGTSLDLGGIGQFTFTENTFRADAPAVYVDNSEGSLALSEYVGDNAFESGAITTNSKNAIYSSIQMAVDNSDEGSEIQVYEGEYGTFDVSTFNVSLMAQSDSVMIDIPSDERISINEGYGDFELRGFEVLFEGQAIYDRASNNLYENNEFRLEEGTESKGYAIRMEGLTEGTEVTDNTFEDISTSADGEFGNGVVIAGASNHEVVENNFIDNSIGINVGNMREAGELKIKENSFSENEDFDIALNHQEPAQSFIIKSNTFDSDSVGILVLADGEFDIEKNAFLSGTAFLNQIDSEINAEQNYFSSASGPSESQIQGDVDYRPWRMNPIDDEAYDEVITFDDAESWSAFSVVGEVEEAATASEDAEVLSYNAGWTSPDFNDITSVDAAFVKDTKAVGVNYVEDPGTVSRSLGEGWNFVGAYDNGDSQNLGSVFSQLRASIVSFQHPENNEDKTSERTTEFGSTGSILSTANWAEKGYLDTDASVFDGYWVKASENVTLSTVPEPVEEG